MSDLRMTRLGGEGSITIPLELREQLDLKSGEDVALIPTGQGLLIANRKAVAEYAMDKIGEGLRENGVTLDEWIESGRELRGRLVEEQYGLKDER